MFLSRICYTVGVKISAPSGHPNPIFKELTLWISSRPVWTSSSAVFPSRAAALGITELVQKEGSLRFSLPQPDFAKVAAVCGLEKYKGRLLFSAGDKPYLSLRLKKGDDVLKLAGIVLRDFEAAG